MTDFTKILDKAKELETKMKESQENIKKLRVIGESGSSSVKVILDGEGEMQKIEISNELLNEEKTYQERTKNTKEIGTGHFMNFVGNQLARATSKED